MTGFEISKKNEEIFAAVDNGLVIIQCDIENEVCRLSIRGRDTIHFKDIKWDNSKLSVGDRFVVKINTISNISDTIEDKIINREDMIKEYFRLKEILIKENLL